MEAPIAEAQVVCPTRKVPACSRCDGFRSWNQQAEGPSPREPLRATLRVIAARASGQRQRRLTMKLNHGGELSHLAKSYLLKDRDVRFGGLPAVEHLAPKRCEDCLDGGDRSQLVFWLAQHLACDV